MNSTKEASHARRRPHSQSPTDLLPPRHGRIECVLIARTILRRTVTQPVCKIRSRTIALNAGGAGLDRFTKRRGFAGDHVADTLRGAGFEGAGFHEGGEHGAVCVLACSESDEGEVGSHVCRGVHCGVECFLGAGVDGVVE